MRKATLKHSFFYLLLLSLLSSGPIYSQEATASWDFTVDLEATTAGNIHAAPVTHSVECSSILRPLSFVVPESDQPNINKYIEFSVAPVQGNTFTMTEITYYAYSQPMAAWIEFFYSFSPDFENYESFESLQIWEDKILKIRGLNITIPEGDTLYIRICPFWRSTDYERLRLENLSITGHTTPYTPPANLTYGKESWCHDEGTAIADYTGPEGGTFSGESGLVIDPETGNIDISGSLPGNYTVSYTASNEVVAATDIIINPVSECLIEGPDAPLCPSSNYNFSAPEGMQEYLWTVTGNATITGDATASSIEIETGESCETAFTLTLTITNETGCSSTCNTEILVGEPVPLTLTVPERFITSSCLSQEEINNQFNEWLSQASFEGGCNAMLTASAANGYPVPPDACGGRAEVIWTVAGDCGSSVEKTSSFTVPDVTPVSLTVPDDMTIETSCLPQPDIDLAFNNWLSQAKIEGGCNTRLTTSPASGELIPPDACGGSITVEWTATSDCEDVAVKSATFTVPSATLPISEYAFIFEAPDEICSNTMLLVPMTFKTTAVGDTGYDAVRFKIATSGPDNVTFTATDSNNTPHTFQNNGYWGPSSGFMLPAEYQKTTNWEINFAKSGTYTISFSLVDATSDEIVGNLSETITLEVGIVPSAPVFNPAANTYTCDGTVKTAEVTTGMNEEVTWYTTESGTEMCAAPSASAAGTYTAWAESRNLSTGCTSTSRTKVTLSLYSTAPASISGTQMICTGGTANLTVSLPGEGPWNFTWTDGTNDYQVLETNNAMHTLTVSPSATTTYMLSGQVTDGSGTSWPGTGEATVYVGPVTTVPHIMACRNTTVKIPVTVKSFSDVRDISLSLKYNYSVLKYTGFENGAIDFGEGGISVHDVPYAGDYHILRISKVSEKQDLPALTDDEVLLWLNFDYTNGFSELEWIDSPDDSWCSYSFVSALNNTGFETTDFCDLPSDAYYINGSVSANPVPDVDIVFNGMVAGYNDSFTFCSNENIHVTLQALEGKAPYTITWKVNDGAEQSAVLDDGDELFNGTLPAGTHILQLTSLTDANGCQIADVSLYKTILTVNAEPDVFFTINDSDLLPNDVVSYCADLSPISLALADMQDGRNAQGVAPFNFSFSISNGGTNGSIKDAGFGTPVNLTDYLPKDPHGQPVAGEYTINLTSFSDGNGCSLSPEALTAYTYTLVIKPQPDFFPAINEVPVAAGSELTFCYDEPSINLKLLDTSDDIPAEGIPPFNLGFTINSGDDILLTDINYNAAVDLLQYLPTDSETGEITAGSYALEFTHFSDANGCSVNGEVLKDFIYTIRINPKPMVTITPKDAACFGTDGGSVTMEPANLEAVYKYTLEPGGLASGEHKGLYVFTGLTAGTYTWTMTDISTTCTLAGSVTIEEPDAISLSGSISYYNISNSPLSDVTISLLEPASGSVVVSTTTNEDGDYYIDQICPGIYNVEINTVKEIYSINSTDAGQVNAWNISQSGNSWPSVEKVRFLAGDVNGDSFANSGDAAMIQNYFLTLGMEVNFDSPWEFWKANDPITLQPQQNNLLQLEIPAGDTSVEQDFYGLVSGDFNRSYIPAVTDPESRFMKSAQTPDQTVFLLKGEDQVVNAGETVELPVIAMSAMQLGAISLILEYPTENMEVIDVFLKDNPGLTTGFNSVNNLLIIGWNSVNPLIVEAGEPVLTIRLRVTSEPADLPLYFDLAPNPLNELADENLLAIEDVSLIMDGLFVNETVTGTVLPEHPESLTLECFPNPFDRQLTIRYTIPDNGYVNLDVTGMTGNRINIILDEYKTQGGHIANTDALRLVPGVYHVTLRFTDKTGHTVLKTSRIIRK